MEASLALGSLVEWALALLEEWGYLIAFLATLLENVFVVGTVTPGETIVIAAGFVSSSGALNPWLLGVLAFFGTVLGSNLSYLFGRRGGRATLEKMGQRFFVSERRLKAAEGYFLTHGPKTILIARFAAGVKNFVPMIAGVARMTFWVFEAYTLIGAVVYSAAMVLTGYFFGEQMPTVLKVISSIGWGGVLLLAALLAFGEWQRRKRIRRKMSENIAAAECFEEGVDGKP